MNRKQRRAERSQSAPVARNASPGVAEMFAEAVRQHQAGLLGEAEQLYRKILRLDAGHTDSLHLLGVLAHQAGRNDLAVDLIACAIAQNGRVPAFHCNLGLALTELGRLDEAVKSFGTALILKPDYAEAHCNLGLALQAQGKMDRAVASYRQALADKPNYVAAHYNLGLAFQQQGELDSAVASFRQALARASDFTDIHHSLGLALHEQGKLDAAEDSYRHALTLRPDHDAALNSLGTALRMQGGLERAATAYQRALSAKPNQALTYLNLGNLRKEQGQLDPAVAAYRQALAWQPDFAEAHHNLGMALLARGDLPAGWEELEWRLSTADKIEHRRDFVQPLWRGEAEQGRTLLLHGEQGIGDSLQFCRYAGLAAERGLRVILEVQPSLVRLLGRMTGVERVVGYGEALPSFDLHCPLPSLPYVFETTSQTIPAAVPYLDADPDLVAGWRRHLASCRGITVGIAWRGNPSHIRDRHRSADPSWFSFFLDHPGVEIVSLQKDARPEELAALGRPGSVLDAGPALGDFADTAALLTALDLVVSVDTSICHLAGALGVPTWTLLDFAPDWRWQRDRSDSPWYPGMRLFRQNRPGDWQTVAEAVRAELLRLYALPSPANPASSGARKSGAGRQRPTELL